MTDRISAADQLVSLLRQRLIDQARAQRKSGAARGAASRSAGPVHGVQAIAALDGLDDRAAQRAIVQNILADQFGADLVNDAEFQQIVDKVTTTLRDHPGGAQLLERLTAELRAPPK